jgi:hypothetical protein
MIFIKTNQTVALVTIFLTIAFGTIIAQAESKSDKSENSVNIALNNIKVFNKFEFKNHEHPFNSMTGEKYDQNTGNKVCGNKWLDTPLISIKYNDNFVLFKSAFDGVNIYQQNHLWYHLEANICVANV